jgi:serine/threonine protein kinase
MIGQTLNNRFYILSLLGEGGMGKVYLATDQNAGQQVAVKVLAPQLSAKPEMLERFHREAEALRQLDHPNIVRFVDAFSHEGQFVIVMEYVPGGSLHSEIQKGPLPIERARQIALDLCDALIRAHRLKIIHRDLKPENVLLTQDGVPKLADFGVARLSEGTRVTQSGTQVGTPYYMAPEAWEGRDLDAQADIWSLGVMLFEMLAGQVPFGGDTGAVVMNKVLNTPPPDLNKLRSEVTVDLAAIVRQMITRDKNRRYKTVRQVSVDFESGRPTTNFKSFPVYIGGGAILLILIAGLSILLNPALQAAINPELETATQSFLSQDPSATSDRAEVATGTPVTVSSWEQGKLIYVRRNASKVYFLDMFDFSQSDQPQVLLSPESPTESRFYAPWLSPDGKSLVFDDLYRGKIFIMDLENAVDPKLVNNCSFASLSPDGQRAVCGLSGEDYFPIFDTQTGVMVGRIDHGMFGAVIPVWSPDGIEIAFSVLHSGGGSSVWKIDADGGDPFPLATEQAENYTAAWSPDGRWLAFQSTLTSNRSEVWIVRSDGSERKQITFSGGGENWSRGPCFSPDGQWLAFVSNRNGSDGDDFGDVFVVSLLTGETIQVTDTEGRVLDFRVTWGN